MYKTNFTCIQPEIYFKESASFRGIARYDLSFRRRDTAQREFKRTLFAKVIEAKLKKLAITKPALKENLSEFFKYSPRLEPSLISQKLAKSKLLFSNEVFKLFLSTNKYKCYTRAPHKKKKTKLVSGFSKTWQKFEAKLLEKNLFPFATHLLSRFRKTIKQKKSHSYNVFHRLSDNQILGFLDLNLLAFVKLFFPSASFKYCLDLIASGACSVNGTVCTDNFLILQPYTIVRFNFSALDYIIFFFLSFRVSKVFPSFGFSGLKTKIFYLPETFIINFNTFEIFILPYFNFYMSPTNFRHVIVSLKTALIQRFFQKQKRFGLGRLL